MAGRDAGWRGRSSSAVDMRSTLDPRRVPHKTLFRPCPQADAARAGATLGRQYGFLAERSSESDSRERSDEILDRIGEVDLRDVMVAAGEREACGRRGAPRAWVKPGGGSKRYAASSIVSPSGSSK